MTCHNPIRIQDDQDDFEDVMVKVEAKDVLLHIFGVSSHSPQTKALWLPKIAGVLGLSAHDRMMWLKKAREMGPCSTIPESFASDRKLLDGVDDDFTDAIGDDYIF